MRHPLRFAFGLLLCTSLTLSAKNLPLDISNYLSVEYDDNVFTTGSGDDGGVAPISSFVLIEEIEFLLDSQVGNTYYGIRYIPTFKYYENRPGDSTDISNAWDFRLNHDFTPRTSFQLHQILRQAQEPEIVTGDVSFRNNNDYLYNSVVADLITQVVPDKTSVQVSGRYADFAYEDNEVADTSDYQQAVGGLDVIQILQPETSLAAQVRYLDLDYKADYRSSETIQGGLALAKVFNPKLDGEIRAGYETQTFSDPVSQDTDSPYASFSINYQPLKGNRFTLGMGYEQAKSPVNTFTMQERFSFTGAYANDLTAGLTLVLSGTYYAGSFSTDNATELYDPTVDSAGDEESLFFTTALNYNLNVRNALVLSYKYSDLNSDVRPDSDYDRNRISLGWKYSL